MDHPNISSTFVRFCRLSAMAAIFVASVAAQAQDKKPTTPREMFRDLGVDDSYFDRLADGKSVDAADSETLMRVMFRLRIFPWVDLDRWAMGQKELDRAIERPVQSRGSIYRLRGRVVEVVPVEPPAEAAERYEMARYFRCRVQLDSLDRPADVYTEIVPKEWQKGAKPNASGGAFGAFIMLAEKIDGQPLLIFAAPRLAWYPDNLLGQLGMDFGLLDTVQNQKPITVEDREAFYEMLAAVGRAKPGELLDAAEKQLPTIPEDWRWTDREGQTQYSVVPLFNEPDTQRGRLVELLGAARRVVKIQLDPTLDADIIARFGFDHYFMISLFTGDSQGNPLTFCVRDLPEGMPYGNLPRYGETVRIAGFFLKTWSYSVPRLADPALQPDPKTHKQLSPLLIGRSLEWYPPPKPPDTTNSTAVIVVALALAMLILWGMAWRNRRREKQWLDKMESPPDFSLGIDFGRVGESHEDRPDFSRTAEMDHGEKKTENREKSDG